MEKIDLSCNQKEAWITFVVTHAVATKQIDKHLSALGFPGLDVYDVLLTLEDSPGGKLRMSDLAEQIMLSRSGITRLVDRLEREGLIRRVNCANDRRATYAVITDKGRGLRMEMWPAYKEGILNVFASKMSCEEARILSSVFQRILEGYPRELLHGMPETCPRGD